VDDRGNRMFSLHFTMWTSFGTRLSGANIT
jgi:hypothetical protein